MEEFEKILEEIFFLVSGYGGQKYLEQNGGDTKFDKSLYDQYCYEGFKIAQKKIYNELKQNQKERFNLKSQKKGADQEQIKKIKKEIRILEWKDRILRHLVDTIVWQLIEGRLYIARRLYNYEQGEINLQQKSFKAVLSAADEINSKDQSLAVISDLTSYVQLGDLLIRGNDGFSISEIKTGKKNKEALRLIDFFEANDIPYDQETLENKFDNKFANQIRRIIDQKDKIKKAKTIITEDVGIDPKLDSHVYLFDGDLEMDTYHAEMIKMMNDLIEKDWAYDAIEGIIHIGFYKNDFRAMGKKIIEMLTRQSSGKEFPIYNFASITSMPIAEPIFLKPFPPETILDIIFGRIFGFIGIDFEELIKLLNHLGFNAKWGSTKKTTEIVRKLPKGELFTHNNRGITFEINEQKYWLGSGLITKMLFNHVKPSSAFLVYKYAKKPQQKNLAT